MPRKTGTRYSVQVTPQSTTNPMLAGLLLPYSINVTIDESKGESVQAYIDAHLARLANQKVVATAKATVLNVVS